MIKVNIKKLCIVLIIITYVMCFKNVVLADEILDESLDYVWLEEEIYKAKDEKNNLNILSKVAIGYDRNSKTILFGKNENQKVKMASTTKIMTAVILLENVTDLNQEIEVCKEAASVGGSRLGLKTGDKITYEDLLYGLLLCSGNDAAIQIAVSVSGTVENFANLMNNKAKELNLKNTHFVTPHGLDQEEHYTTALELAKIADYALNIPKFSEIVNTKTYMVNINNYSKNISNTNELLGYLEGVNGVKTGFTNGAGRCLVTSVNRNNFNIITVVLGADTKKIRTKDSIKLIEYVFNKYELVNLNNIVKEEFDNWLKINQDRIKVNKGVQNNIKLKLKDTGYINYPIEKEKIDNIKIYIDSLDYIEAPVLEDELIGSITVKIGEEQIENINIVCKSEVKKKGVFEYFKICTEKIVR